MDRIQFLVSVETRGTDSLRTVEPVVNGIPLRELAAAAEAAAAASDGRPELAGAYAGLHDGDELKWPSKHFLGRPELQWFEDGDTVLLGCTCGEWGCWPLTAQVGIDDAAVSWSGFRNGHRDWDLSGLGPFAFERAQYEAALGKPVDPSAAAR